MTQTLYSTSLTFLFVAYNFNSIFLQESYKVQWHGNGSVKPMYTKVRLVFIKIIVSLKPYTKRLISA